MPAYDANLRTMIVITNAQTQGQDVPGAGRPPDFGRFAYPGWDSDSGLRGETTGTTPPAGFAANVRLAIFNQNTSDFPAIPHYNLVCAYAQTRISQRPLVNAVQRSLHLVKAVQLMLQSSDASWRPAGWPQFTGNVPVLAEGGSFGAMASTWLVMLFPDQFHGAFSDKGPASFRRSIDEQESWRYLKAMTALVDDGKALVPRNIMDWTRLLWEVKDAMFPTNTVWSPFFHTSLTRAYRDGVLQRPVYFHFCDEDAVSTGTDSLPLFRPAAELPRPRLCACHLAAATPGSVLVGREEA